MRRTLVMNSAEQVYSVQVDFRLSSSFPFCDFTHFSVHKLLFDRESCVFSFKKLSHFNSVYVWVRGSPEYALRTNVRGVSLSAFHYISMLKAQYPISNGWKRGFCCFNATPFGWMPCVAAFLVLFLVKYSLFSLYRPFLYVYRWSGLQQK